MTVPLCCTVNAVGHCVKCFRRYCAMHVRQLVADRDDSFATCECGLRGEKRWKAFPKTGEQEYKLVP